MGRPKLSKRKKRSEQLVMYLNEEEAAIIRRAALRVQQETGANIPRAHLVRSVALEALRKLERDSQEEKGC